MADRPRSHYSFRCFSPFCLLLALAVTAPAYAENAAGLFDDGRFAQAAAAARTEGALALAARATLIQAAYGTNSNETALALIARAEKDAQAAIAANPRDMDARLQQALAIGYRAKLTRSAADTKKARTLMEAVRSAQPQSADAWLAIGGWHGEAIVTLGRLLAGTVLGAKRDVAVADLEQSVARGGGRPLYAGFAGLLLLRMDKDYADKAATLLDRATRLSPHDGLDALMQRSAAQVLARLRTHDVSGARKLAGLLSPFGRIDKD